MNRSTHVIAGIMLLFASSIAGAQDIMGGSIEQQQRMIAQMKERMGDMPLNDMMKSMMKQSMGGSGEDARKMQTDMVFGLFASNYSLTPEQNQELRSELQRKIDENRASMGDDAVQLERLEAEIRKTMVDGLEGAKTMGDFIGLMESDKLLGLQLEVQEIRVRHPFAMMAELKSLDELLPEEQRLAGRERMERFERLTQQMVKQFGAPIAEEGSLLEEVQDLGSGFEKSGDELKDLEGLQAKLSQLTGRLEARIASIRDERGLPAARLDSWDAYAERFIRHYELQPAQVSAALSILDEVKAVGSKTRDAQKKERLLLAKITVQKDRKAKLAELDAPLEKIFEDLSARLSALLTAAQRNMPPFSK